MSSKQERFRVAVLDDYQNVALSLADWSALDARATVTVFNDHLADADALVERLQPFDIICVMRERSPMTRSIIERLPKLRLIASTATRNASIDLKAAEERAIQVVHTGYTSAPTIDLTSALILGVLPIRISVPRAAERFGNAAYRLRLPRPLRSLLSGYGHEHLPLARRPSSGASESRQGEENCRQVTPVFSACRKPLCRGPGFSGSLRAHCSLSSDGARRQPRRRTMNWRRTVTRPRPRMRRRQAAWGPSS